MRWTSLRSAAVGGVMCREMVEFLVSGITVMLVNEPTYSQGSTDNRRKYDYEYGGEDKFHHACAHGVLVGDSEEPEVSAVILGIGGATGTHKHSFAYKDDTCFIAAGDSVFALGIPELDIKWSKKVDFATCFGIYYLVERDCLISWGEVDVLRMKPGGEEVWSFCGADIFTEGMEIHENSIELTDFNNRVYTIDIDSGNEVEKYT